MQSKNKANWKPLRAKTPLTRKSSLRLTKSPKSTTLPTKSIKKQSLRRVGPTTKEWLKTRTEWLRANWPNHQGYYECYICGKWVDSSEITLDHVIPRSKAPELRLDMANLKPCCYNCNQEKGSKVYGT